MKKSLYLMGSLPPPYGGVTTFCTGLLNNLLKLDYAVNLVYLSDVLHDEYKNSVRLDMRLRNILKFFFSVKKESVIIDSMNLFLEYPDSDAPKKGLIFMSAKIIKNFKWIKVFHDGTYPTRYKKFSHEEKQFIKHSIKNIDYLIVVSEELSFFFRNELEYKNDITVISSLLPREYRMNINIPKEIDDFILNKEKIFITVGSSNEEYGILNIARTVSKIRNETEIDIGLLVIDPRFCICSEEYNRKKKEISSFDFVFYYDKGIPPEQMCSVFAKCDCFIRGVFFESFGLSRVEAIMSGIPVIATNVGETYGMLLYDCDDLNTLEENIRKILFKKETFVKNICDSQVYFCNMALDNFNKILEKIGYVA